MNELPEAGFRLDDSGMQAISRDQMLAYLEASGDDNALHTDPHEARRVGLAGNPVPGLMLVGVALAWSADQMPAFELKDFSSRFFAPILVDSAFSISGKVVAVDREQASFVLRLTLRSAAAPCAVVEARLQLADRAAPST